MLLNFQIFPNSSCLLLLIFNNIIAVRGHTLYDSNSQNSDTLVMFHIHEKYISFSDDNGAEIMINTDNISLIELPLVKVEEAILQGYQEMMSE